MSYTANPRGNHPMIIPIRQNLTVIRRPKVSRWVGLLIVEGLRRIMSIIPLNALDTQASFSIRIGVDGKTSGVGGEGTT